MVSTTLPPPPTAAHEAIPRSAALDASASYSSEAYPPQTFMKLPKASDGYSVLGSNSSISSHPIGTATGTTEPGWFCGFWQECWGTCTDGCSLLTFCCINKCCCCCCDGGNHKHADEVVA